MINEIESRRAFRALSEKPIEREIIDRVMTAATYAPSCANKQPWRFIVMDDNKKLELVKKHLAGGNYWAEKSPAVVAVLTREDLDARLPGKRNYAYFDTGMACMNLQLQAVREGLYAHPIAGFEAVELRKELGINEDWTLLTLIILGYPGDDSHLSEKHKELEISYRNRKPVEDVVFYNSWPDSPS